MMKLQKTILAGLLLLLAFPLFSQQTSETTLDIKQIEPLPLDNFIVGTASGNDTLARTAVNIITAIQNGITSANVQAALEELQTEIDAVAAGAADGVTTAGTYDAANDEIDFTVDAPGTSFSVDLSGLVEDGDLLDNSATNEAQSLAFSTQGATAEAVTLSDVSGSGGGQIIFSDGTNTEVNRSSGTFSFNVPSLDDADSDITNEAQTLSKVGSTVTLTDANGSGGGSFTDEVNDADASASNELQTISITNGVATLDLGGGNVEVFDPFTTEDFFPTSGSTVSIANAPNVTSEYYVQVWRGGVFQSVAFSGTATDVTVNSTTVTFNYRALSAGEHVKVRYIEQ